MADQDIGKLALFRNDKKANDRQPDYRGTGEIDGHGKVKVSAWIRKAASNGMTYMSLAVQTDDYHPQAETPPRYDDRQSDERPADNQPPPSRPAQEQLPRTQPTTDVEPEVDTTIPF